MSPRSIRFAGLIVVVSMAAAGAGQAWAQQYPIMERVAQKVIEKYQASSCADLAAKRAQPPTAEQQEVVQSLRDDAAMRTAFINRVAAPIANKLFECSLIP